MAHFPAGIAKEDEDNILFSLRNFKKKCPAVDAAVNPAPLDAVDGVVNPAVDAVNPAVDHEVYAAVNPAVNPAPVDALAALTAIVERVAAGLAAINRQLNGIGGHIARLRAGLDGAQQ